MYMLTGEEGALPPEGRGRSGESGQADRQPC